MVQQLQHGATLTITDAVTIANKHYTYWLISWCRQTTHSSGTFIGSNLGSDYFPNVGLAT